MVSVAATAKSKTPGNIPAGSPVPDKLGAILDGTEIRAKDYQGRVLVVTFWASWCGPCMNELPVLEKIQRVAKKDRLQVVAINIEDRDRYKAISRKLSEFESIIAHDNRKDVRETFGVNGIPHMVIVGQDGNVLSVHRGYSDDSLEDLVDEINLALGVKPENLPKRKPKDAREKKQLQVMTEPAKDTAKSAPKKAEESTTQPDPNAL
jgi:thiol-disulfide isomerase/thioredoxin